MSKIIPLFKTDSVQNSLCEAADMGLSEIIIVGKKQSGGYWIRLSPCKNAYEMVGICEALKHELLMALDAEDH